MNLETCTRDAEWLSQVKIRYLEEEDLPGLEWEGEFHHFRRVYAEAYKRHQAGLSVLWVAELNGIMIGQVFIQLICDRPELANGEDRAYLYSFRVRPEYRSMGIGARMMEAVEDDLRERGFQWTTLNVARENRRAQRLYLRQGYRISAPEAGQWSYQDEAGMWHHMVEPAWRMQKRL